MSINRLRLRLKNLDLENLVVYSNVKPTSFTQSKENSGRKL